MTADKQQIIDLETRFWEAIQAKDAAGAQALVADESLVTGPSGTMRIDPAKFGEMMRDAPWTLEQFKFEQQEVIFPTDDVAVIAYKVHQQGEMEGKPMDMRCADSTVWVKRGGDWKAALHTETLLQDAKAREPEPA
jgi:ketosteroid isomerase-like protein